MRQYDRQAAADEHKRVEGPDPFDQMNLMRRRPRLGVGRLAVAKHDVYADQAREKHDFRDQKEPHGQLAIGERQTHVEAGMFSRGGMHNCFSL